MEESFLDVDHELVKLQISILLLLFNAFLTLIVLKVTLRGQFHRTSRLLLRYVLSRVEELVEFQED